MILRRVMFVFFARTAFLGATSLRAAPKADQPPRSQDHMAWVEQVLRRMQAIKPGMTREQLLTVFTTEGGLSSGLRRTFVSRDCPYFKVDVAFQAIGRPHRDGEGRATLLEDPKDIIVTMCPW
jgi:hypothetical protein